MRKAKELVIGKSIGMRRAKALTTMKSVGSLTVPERLDDILE